MPLIKFRDFRFRADALAVIEQVNAIVNEYQGQGFRLTLRQLYYQFVARGLIANQQREYKRLGSIINDGRLAGLIDWNAIEDRGRNLQSFSSWSSPAEIIKVAASSYRMNPWRTQRSYVEVWVEKEALIGVVEIPCARRRVPHFACKGYTSQSEMWLAAWHRFRGSIRDGKRVTLIHLGDHDPSGIDMTRDIEDRLAMFGAVDVRVRRIALNMDQVEEHSPPPNPAKFTDSRCAGYVEGFGSESWELDALEPSLLDSLITGEIEALIDEDAWNAAMEEEGRDRKKLAKLAREAF